MMRIADIFTVQKNRLLPPVLIALLASAYFSGCLRGSPSDKPPIHLNPNMDQQEKFQPMEASGLFENNTAMRSPAEGTVARGELRANTVYYAGKNADGTFVEKSPVPATTDNLVRGRERFDIFCSPCHSRIGDGTGIVTQYKYPEPATLHEQRLRDIEDGYIFDVISNGFNNMPAYRFQVPVSDRWMIVQYVRALQRSQHAALRDVPEDARERIRQERNR